MKRLLFPLMIVAVMLLIVTQCDVEPTVTPPTETPTIVSPIISPTPPQSNIPTPTPEAADSRAESASFDKPKSETMEENGIMDNVLQALLDFCMSAALPTIAGACALDIFVGIGAALRSGKFDWRKIGNFYQTQVLSLVVPYIGALAVIALVPDLVDFLPIAVAPTGLFAGIMAKLGGSILANAQVLSAGGAE